MDVSLFRHVGSHFFVKCNASQKADKNVLLQHLSWVSGTGMSDRKPTDQEGDWLMICCKLKSLLKTDLLKAH